MQDELNHTWNDLRGTCFQRQIEAYKMGLISRLVGPASVTNFYFWVVCQRGCSQLSFVVGRRYWYVCWFYMHFLIKIIKHLQENHDHSEYRILGACHDFWPSLWVCIRAVIMADMYEISTTYSMLWALMIRFCVTFIWIFLPIDTFLTVVAFCRFLTMTFLQP